MQLRERPSGFAHEQSVLESSAEPKHPRTTSQNISPPPPPRVSAPEPAQSVSSPSEQRAFRFVLTGSKIELAAAEDITGDFHPRRGPLAWQPGMIYCRLLDESQRVLAEQTVPAPDHMCIVLDPNLPDASGNPQPAALTPTGPVVFQMRMPRVDSATHMKVYRLQGIRPAGLTEEPIGELLATIALPQ